MMKMIKFFTSFDRLNVPLKYVTLNPFSFNRFLSWIDRYGSEVKEVIIDTGVDYLFKERNLKDYPSWYISEYLRIISHMNNVISRRYGCVIWVVIPDIPVDYLGRSHLYPWNVKRTVEYINYFKEKVIGRFPRVNFVAVVQGARDSVSSVINTYLKYRGLYDSFELIGLGPTCTTRKWKKLAYLIRCFDRVTDVKYHVFGPGLRTVREVASKVRMMYSFDSTAYGLYYRVTSRREDAFKMFVSRLPTNVDY